MSTQTEISETINIKGHRRCVQVMYRPLYQYFKIPDGLDLDDETVVKKWWVKWATLYIEFVDTKRQLLEIDPHYTDEYDFKYPAEGDEILDPEDVGQGDMYKEEDGSDEEEVSG